VHDLHFNLPFVLSLYFFFLSIIGVIGVIGVREKRGSKGNNLTAPYAAPYGTPYAPSNIDHRGLTFGTLAPSVGRPRVSGNRPDRGYILNATVRYGFR